MFHFISAHIFRFKMVVAAPSFGKNHRCEIIHELEHVYWFIKLIFTRSLITASLITNETMQSPCWDSALGKEQYQGALEKNNL